MLMYYIDLYGYRIAVNLIGNRRVTTIRYQNIQTKIFMKLIEKRHSHEILNK